MNQIAFIYGNTLIYWGNLIIAMAVLTGIVFFLAAWLRGSEGFAQAVVFCPLAILLALLCGRLLHWYCRADSYESFQTAITDFSRGGFALAGIFGGCLLAVLILRLLRVIHNTPFLLDCLSIGGCAAIALGRLSCFFTDADRGEILTGMTGLPWVSSVINATSGLPEYRFATFFFQAIIAALIFVVLMILSRKKHRTGDFSLVFLLLYCPTQIVLDSTRYDSLRLRSNGFISIVQVLCAITLVAVIAILLIRIPEKATRKRWHMITWPITALSLCGAGYLEYYVQRHGDKARIAYSGMSGFLFVIVLLGIFLLHVSNKRNPRFSKA